jgi:hypothetical protein
MLSSRFPAGCVAQLQVGSALPPAPSRGRPVTTMRLEVSATLSSKRLAFPSQRPKIDAERTEPFVGAGLRGARGARLRHDGARHYNLVIIYG